MTTFWAFDGGDEAEIELVLTTPAEVDQVSLLVGGLGDNSHIANMKLEVKQEDPAMYEIPQNMMVMSGGKDTNTNAPESVTDIIELPPEQKILRITFRANVKKVKVTVLDTDDKDKDGILNEILIQKKDDASVQTCSDAGWRLYEDNCYRIFLVAGSVLDAQRVCHG